MLGGCPRIEVVARGSLLESLIHDGSIPANRSVIAWAFAMTKS